MGGKVDARLIPVRFMLTMGHLIVTLCIFDTMEDNVVATVDDGVAATDAQKESVRSDIRMVLVLSLVCFAFDFLGMFGGFSIFFQAVMTAPFFGLMLAAAFSSALP